MFTELIAKDVQAGYEAVAGPSGGLAVRDSDPKKMGMMKGKHFIILLECAYAMEEDMIPALVMPCPVKIGRGRHRTRGRSGVYQKDAKT